MINPYKKIKELEEEREIMLAEEIMSDEEYFELKEQLKDPKEVIRAVIGRETKWIDYEAMDYGAKKIFYEAVVSMKDNKAFRSLFGYEDIDGVRVNGKIVKDFIEGAVIESSNFQMMRDMQMSINGVEYVWKCLEDIIDPDINKKDTDSNNQETI